MSRTVTLTIADHEVAALADATADAQSKPITARYAGLVSLLRKLDPRSPTLAQPDRAAGAVTPKTTRALLAEHEPEIDAELVRRRTSRSPAHGGSL
jgi:hypothetical protein